MGDGRDSEVRFPAHLGIRAGSRTPRNVTIDNRQRPMVLAQTATDANADPAFVTWRKDI